MVYAFGGLLSGATEATYRYDVYGNCQWQVVDGAETRNVVDANRDYAQVIEQSNAQGQLIASYVFADERISQIRDGQRSTYHADGLGSIRALSNDAGEQTDSYTYEAFGQLEQHTGTTVNEFRYTGEQYDPNLGFYYLRARYYNPANGRFPTMNTYQGRIHEPQTLHKYMYVHADPVNNIDPSGHMSLASVNAGSYGMSIISSTARVGFALGKKYIGRAIIATGTVAIGHIVKKEVKKCLASRGKKCRIPNLVVIGAVHKEAQEHIDDAQKGWGSNGFLISPLQTYKKGGNPGGRQWYTNKVECKGNVTGISGKSCDEWPFFTTLNGGQKGYDSMRVSLRLINHSDNVLSGQVWGRAVRKGKNGDKYLVVPYGPMSFYYSNGTFGF